MSVLLYDMTDGLGILASLEFDVTLSEVHTTQTNPTRHPIEKGASLSDHIQIMPSEVELVGFITNTPVHQTPFRPQLGALVVNRLATVLKGPGTAARLIPATAARFRFPGTTRAYSEPRIIGTGYDLGDRAAEVYQKLVELQRKATIFEVFTDLQTYPEMVLVSISAPSEAKDSVAIRMKFQSVKFAQFGAAQVATKKTIGPAEKRAVKKVDLSQGTDLAALDEQRSSVLGYVSGSRF